MKWSIELSQNDINYQPRTAIKAEALAEFIVESTIPDPSRAIEEPPIWIVYVDVSSCADGSGAGVILSGPDDFVLQYSLRINFRASNNEAEYDALIAGLCMASKAGA